MQMPTLYKKTSAGATQIWFREVEGDKYRSVSGQIDGAQTASGWKTAKPKNVGKSNETSGAEQAQLECEAAYRLKLAQGGYHETLEAIGEAKFFKPMLAQEYGKRPITGAEFKAGVFTQPKLDGVRCIATSEGLFSRMGKPIPSCPHIEAALAPLFEQDPDLIFDGELYADHLNDNFNEIISLVRKAKPTAEHFEKTAAAIRYHIYDLPSHEETFSRRNIALHELLYEPYANDPLVRVETLRVYSTEELDELNALWVADGYEGQMVRRDGRYKNGRSFDLLKRKSFMDGEFTVISVHEGEGNRAGMAGFITYELGDGRTFKSGIKGNWQYATQLLKDAGKYVGGQGTVRYFQMTPDGIPRFPVTVALYEGERDV